MDRQRLGHRRPREASRFPRVHVEIITIGDELLLGHTIDTNGAHLGRALAALGVAVTRRTVVSDDADAIADAVSTALGRADGVITTGGLGPTSDDRSKPAIAALFGRTMALHEPTVERLHARWAARGLPGELPAANRQQAMIPSGAAILENQHGTAPGIWIENDRGGWVAMLPGVPREMRGMLADALLPRLAVMVGNDPPVIRSRMLRLTGIPEARVADVLRDVSIPTPLALAYLPGWEGVDLRLTSSTLPAASADACLAAGSAVVRAALDEFVYADRDIDLADVVVAALRGRGWTIGVAESCTGGLLGARLTAMGGASDVVRGGVIAYHNEVKTSLLGVPEEVLAAHGAVSVEVAAAMATGARSRTGADVGVGITGIAGPAGATPGKPVGTVCIAIETPAGAVSEAGHFIGDRDEIRRRATQAALAQVLFAASRTSVDACT
jgi:nicotinamide-nucleotide amidase